MRYCKKCGAALNDEMLFCQKCGTKCVEEQPKAAYAVLEDVDVNTPAPKKNKNSQGSRTVATVLAVFLIIILIIILGVKGCSITPSGNEDQSSQSAVKSGEDYEGDVFTAFWEGASKSFGVEYSDYKFAHTSYSWIDDFTTTDGYTAHYYLIQTAFETKNAFGQKVLHPVTARCYYVPEYSNTVYTTYMTLDGEAVLFDEEKEDWLMGMGGGKAPTTNTETTEAKKDESASTNSSNQNDKPNEGQNNPPKSNPSFSGSTCLDINTNNGMPASNVTKFDGTDSICVAGKFTGLTGENNVKIIWTCPDGYVYTDQQYCYTNGDTLQSWKTAEDIGSGSASVSIFLDTTGETLATYYFTVTGAPTYTDNSVTNDTEATQGENYSQSDEMDDVNTGLAYQDWLSNLPSLDDVEWETEPTEERDLDGIATQLTPEELEELEKAAENFGD